MRKSVAIVVLASVVACVAWAVSPPQYTLQRTLKGSIGASPLVSVGEVQGGAGAYVINVTSSVPEVARGLALILTKEYNFGGIHVSIRVLDAKGSVVETPDTPTTTDPVQESKRHFEAVLAHNPLFVGITGKIFVSYSVEIEPAIVQFWNDDVSDPHGNTNLIAADAFRRVCREQLFGDKVTPWWSTAVAQTSFAAEGFLPAVAHSSGLFGSLWTTDVWVLSAGATSVELWFHPVNKDNSSVAQVTLDLTAPTTRVSDIVATLFKTSGTGALRYRANGLVRMIGRTSSPSLAAGTTAQIATGVSLHDVATGGAEGRALAMVVDQRAGFRANLGLINAQAAPATVRAWLLSADGTPVSGFEALEVGLPPFGVTQINDLLSRLPAGERAGLLVRVRVTSEQGALIAYLCDIDNATNDPTYQEAFPSPI